MCRPRVRVDDSQTDSSAKPCQRLPCLIFESPHFLSSLLHQPPLFLYSPLLQLRPLLELVMPRRRVVAHRNPPSLLLSSPTLCKLSTAGSENVEELCSVLVRLMPKSQVVVPVLWVVNWQRIYGRIAVPQKFVQLNLTPLKKEYRDRDSVCAWVTSAHPTYGLHALSFFHVQYQLSLLYRHVPFRDLIPPSPARGLLRSIHPFRFVLHVYPDPSAQSFRRWTSQKSRNSLLTA